MTTPSLEDSATRPPAHRARAGWWHEYVCPTHGTELRPGARAGRPADVHTCPYGCELRGEPYEGAWRVLELQQSARDFRELAHRYAATGDEPDRRAAKDLLTGFCAIYAEAADVGWAETAATWMLRGKLFHQALTEAIWGTSLAHGVLTLLEADERWQRPSQDLAGIGDLFAGLLSTVSEARRVLVDERHDLRSNYTAWLICAGLSSSRVLARLGHEAEVDTWLDGPSGLWAHLDVAIHADGWEWEASTYYHFFVLRAYLLTLRGRVPAELPAGHAARIVSMLRVLVDLSTDGGVLPVLHDGPYRRPQALQELLEVYVLGRQLVDLPGLEEVEAGTRAQLGPAATSLEDQLASWFAGPALPAPPGSSGPRASVSFADAGHLVLRSPGGRWQAVVDAGPHGGAHGHLAKLALYLYGDREVWQPAPGVPPYGSALRHDYYARSAAHPTVRIDGLDQAETSGRLLMWQSGAAVTRAVVSAPGAFPGVEIQRHLVMQGDVLLDAVHVRAAEARHIVVGLRPADRLHATEEEGLFLTTWRDGGASEPEERGRDLHGCHLSSARSVFGWTPVRGPSDDPARLLGGIDWSAQGEERWFVSLYQPLRDPAAARPRLRIVSSTDHGLEVEAAPVGDRAFIVRFEPMPDDETSSGSVPRRLK